jgi:aminomuconate-semialdehyde/2-hydroxymuconate-6-semialdehyde dehydrogenase
MQKLENYISGEMIAPASGDYLDNYNPATGEVYSLIPDSEERDVECAVEAAREAFPAWSKMSAEARHDCLMRVSNLIERDLDALAKAESVDNGKPLLLAKTVDIPRAVSNFKFYATAAMHTATEAHETVGQAINYTLRQPLGVVGCISPWNLPLYLFSWKIAPALAAGCTIVAKPSEITPMTAYFCQNFASKPIFPTEF